LLPASGVGFTLQQEPAFEVEPTKLHFIASDHAEAIVL